VNISFAINQKYKFLNTERFIAKRIITGSNKSKQFSRPIIKISILGVTLGIALMILTLAVVVGFQKEIRNKLIGFGSHITITNYDDNMSDEPVPIEKKQHFLPSLIQNPNIKHIQIYATKNGLIKTKTDNEGVVLKGVGPDYDWTFINQNLKEGKTFTVADTGLSKNIVISKYLADKLELKLNDKMIIYFLCKKEKDGNIEYEDRGKNFFVCGIYETGLEEIDKKLIKRKIKQNQRLNYWKKNQNSRIEIYIKD